MKLPAFVHADDPDTFTHGGLVLVAEFERKVTITCQACKVSQLRLKLLSRSIIGDATATVLLTKHLDSLGWTRLREGGADICPECAGTSHDVCPYCLDYTGGHMSHCPTLFPGFRG
ncbi:hypothetical protein [Mycolicibacterium llatzerense]|uniref:hypothetical protein n=1 Tax=Mycolicibacterium llatzerense TaxID=280871 RepID=UPI0021B4EDB1|nr:hypothetical protein [Mycolicibacterium llatzerense]MCT7372706.1 hypothetical protein [Mycolicibacterium llatzerense]